MNMNSFKDKNLYYVGGIVRDEILGVQSFDIDYCYEGNAIDFCKAKFADNIIKINPDFGTVRLSFNGKEIDIASTREETYPKAGHLPVVKSIGCPLINDLKRRDFTINAMAKNTVTGEIFDPFNGMKDINSKSLRILHDKSFIDDPTRIVRGLKFSVRFGFELNNETKILQDEYLKNINYDMSYFRLKKELMETFNLNYGNAFDKFVEHGIYKLLSKNQIAPKIMGLKIQNAIKNTEVSPWLIYMGFFNIENLPLTRLEKNIIDWVERLDTEKPTNNTPKESILIHSLLTEEKC